MLAMILMVGAAVTSIAGTIDVIVVGPDGAPVPDVAVYIMQTGVNEPPMLRPETAYMDQRDGQFVPHLMVVRKGTAVEFPNSDVTAHHVYSFSRPNNFVLPLYKGDPHDPVKFEHDGVITLGCNIHDHMLAYIVVVDTSVFGVTDASGRVVLTVDDEATDYAVKIWNPRIRDSKVELIQIVSNTQPTDVEITFPLQKKLRARHNTHSNAVAWSEY